MNSNDARKRIKIERTYTASVDDQARQIEANLPERDSLEHARQYSPRRRR